MKTEASAIDTNMLRKIYAGAKSAAVESLTLSVEPGQVFGFLGPNGAGKTTTIGMLLGNVFPTSGSATMLGKPIGDKNTRRSVGYLPEKFQFHEFLSATEFLDMHGRLYGMDEGDRKRRIPEVLEIVGLLPRAKDKLGAFSKGMQQRAGLAQAILHEPRLVILDEPTSALDPLGRRSVRDIVVYLKERGTTVLLNSHLLSEIEMTCDTVAIIKRGQIVRQGTVDEITTPVSSVTVDLESVSPTILSAASQYGTVSGDGCRSGDDSVALAVNDPASSDGGISSSPNLSNFITVSLKEGDTSVTPDLIASLVSAGARIRSVTPVRESLEDAFVRVMGEGDAS